uniref:golgin subfamily A member 2 isoform X2 n=1 Tax=Myxine glutinosa TaxID=7769 RepID=UPI00358E8E4F
MADGGRVARLAAAKKKLKEFQQKGSPGGEILPKKQTLRSKEGSRADTPEEEVDSAEKKTGFGGGENQREEDRDCSTTEKLRQLSLQINGLVSQQPNSLMNGENDGRELEQKNRELLCALDASRQRNDQLAAQLEDVRLQNEDLQMQKINRQQRKSVDDETSLNEQLEVHVQTISILVAEKSELQAKLEKSQQAKSDKAGELDDVTHKLLASRQRMAELEASVSALTSEKLDNSKAFNDLQQERSKLQADLASFRKQNEDLGQRGGEQTERLLALENAHKAARHEISELQQRLEMAELTAQQLSSQTGEADGAHQPAEEKRLLEEQVGRLMEATRYLGAERDQLAQQLLEHGQQWQQVAEQHKKQLTGVCTERDQVQRTLNATQTSLQELEQRIASQPSEPEGPSDVELNLQTQVQKLRQENEEVFVQYQAQVRDNEQLSRLIGELEQRISVLETSAGEQEQAEGERHRLLESAQGERAALGRALSQNRQLKEQLAELQNGFVHMTNENAELGSALHTEQHVKKELGRIVGELKENQASLREQLSEAQAEAEHKLRECAALEARLSELNASGEQLGEEVAVERRQRLEQAQILDRLQHDVATWRDRATLLQSHLNEAVGSSQSKVPAPLTTNDQGEEEVEVKFGLQEGQLGNTDKPNLTGTGISDDSVDVITLEAYQTLKTSMEKLQEKFVFLMAEKAELHDMVEDMDHRCIQLSGETDTIGEYIALYQNQRDIMKRRHKEKEAHIIRLANDKEEMKAKMGELQQLVLCLVSERDEWYASYTALLQAKTAAGLLPRGALATEEQTPGEEVDDVSLQDANSEEVPARDENRDGSTEEKVDANDWKTESNVGHDRTTRQIMQLLHEMQNATSGGGPGDPGLNSTCIPFFYRVDEENEVKIMML